MITTMIGLIPAYGPYVLGLLIALSCLGVPFPATLALIIAGGMVAVNDMSLATVLICCLSGAVVGDLLAYFIGTFAQNRLDRIMSYNGAKQYGHTLALQRFDFWGPPAVFVSRWLITPFAPALNYLSGACAVNFWMFTIAVVVGNTLWVLLFVIAGYALEPEVATYLLYVADIIWLIAALAIALLLGALLFWRARKGQAST